MYPENADPSITPPTTPPPITTTPLPPMPLLTGCDFEDQEHELCSFKQDSDSRAGWHKTTAIDGPTSDHPLIDHTYHNSK